MSPTASGEADGPSNQTMKSWPTFSLRLMAATRAAIPEAALASPGVARSKTTVARTARQAKRLFGWGMTAVGYGDTTPKTLIGRAVALVWMFASVALLASFTAGITSSLTVEGIGGRVQGPEDLHKVRTGVKRGSAAEEELVESHIGIRRYDTVDEGLVAVIGGEIDAFVHAFVEYREQGLRCRLHY